MYLRLVRGKNNERFWLPTCFLRLRFLVLELTVVLIIVYRYVRSIRLVLCSMTDIYSDCPFAGTFLHLTLAQVTECAQPVLGGRGELRHLHCPITACVWGCQWEAGGVSCDAIAIQGVDASQSRPQEAVTQTHAITLVLCQSCLMYTVCRGVWYSNAGMGGVPLSCGV